MRVLVTGGTGYIGSHMVVELLQEKHDVVIVDNLSNSSATVLDRIEEITHERPGFYQLDIGDQRALDLVFQEHSFDAVIHFAALKASAVSVEDPILYYQNNLNSTLNLASVMQAHNVHKVVFSSSAAVYGVASSVPIKETAGALSAANPYGQTKVMCERIWQDIAASNSNWDVTILRYFNPIGAHKSGKIGEDPHGLPNNLVPYISQVAVGTHGYVQVFGDDYDTPDGTGIRDYIHVTDLVKGHLAALEHAAPSGEAAVYNLGTGKGYSVLETIAAFEKASNKKIPYKVVAKRPGDVAVCYADASKARQELGWNAKKNLIQMCEDAWRWQSQNPHGYDAT